MKFCASFESHGLCRIRLLVLLLRVSSIKSPGIENGGNGLKREKYTALLMPCV